MKYINTVLLLFLFASIQPVANAQRLDDVSGKQSIYPIRKDDVKENVYKYTFNSYYILGRDSVYSKPMTMSVYPGEHFVVKDSCIIWRDSVMLYFFQDTFFYGTNNNSNKPVLRAISKGGAWTLMKGADIQYKNTWKPEFESILGKDSLTVDSFSLLTINGEGEDARRIGVFSQSDSIMFVMPNCDFDSCLVINETDDFRLCAVVHSGDTSVFTLESLGIKNPNGEYVFRIHPSGLPPIYLNYPHDIIIIEPEEPSFWDNVCKTIANLWWIGWTLFLLAVVGLLVYIFVFQKRKRVSNVAKNSTDKSGNGEPSANNIPIEAHLGIIQKEYSSIAKLLSEDSESSVPKQNDGKSVVKSEKNGSSKAHVPDNNTEGKTNEGKSNANNEITTIFLQKFGEDVERLEQTINEKYKTLLSLQDEINEKNASFKVIEEERDDLNRNLVAANTRIKEIEVNLEVSNKKHKVAVEKLQEELKLEKENTSKKVKEAEDKAKAELEKVQGELKSEKDNTAKKVKEAEDKIKADLEKVQGELKQEKDNTTKKVKEAEDKVKADLERVQGELKQEKDNTAKKVKEAEDKIIVKLEKVQYELKQEKENTSKKVKEAEDKVKVELTKVQNALKQEKESTTMKVDKARAEEREEKRKAVQLKENEISQLKLDQKFYLDNFTRMEFAQKYAAVLGQLITVAGDVEKSANSLMESDKMEDAYYLYRAQAKYNLNMSRINLKSFLTEVEMISRGQLVFNESAVTKYDKKDPDGSLKKYFFATYLEKYFNALVVFNETLAGLHYFDSKLTAKDTSIFTSTRTKIEEMAGKLGVEIATVKIGEQNKYSDVQILDRVDLGLPTNTIVSIDNCRVSMKGGAKSANKIKIMIQK